MKRGQTKSVKSKALSIIDLAPDEAGTLSVVAELARARVPGAQEGLAQVLSGSNRRTKAIASIILGTTKKKARPAYVTMANRFINASESNVKYGRMLKSSTLRRSLDEVG